MTTHPKAKAKEITNVAKRSDPALRSEKIEVAPFCDISPGSVHSTGLCCLCPFLVELR